MEYLDQFLQKEDQKTDLQRSLEKYSKDVGRSMMEVVSLARDCSPLLFDFADEQERIITICREAAKSTFSLTDLITANNTDTNFLLNAALTVENAANLLLKTVSSTHVVTIEPALVQSLQESVSRLFSVLSLFRIFVGKMRITSSLMAISNLSTSNKKETVPAKKVEPNKQTSPPVPLARTASAVSSPTVTQAVTKTDSKPALATSSSVKLSPNEFIEEELDKLRIQLIVPSDIAKLKEDFAKTPQWILAAWKESRTNTKLAQERCRLVELELDQEKQARTTAEQTILNSTPVAVSRPRGDTVARNEELAQKNLQIEQLKKQQLELEQKYKESMSHYENWKQEVESEFGKQIGQRETQIKDLKSTLENVMKAESGTGEQKNQNDDEIMNSLLDYINRHQGQPEGTSIQHNNSFLTLSSSSGVGSPFVAPKSGVSTPAPSLNSSVPAKTDSSTGSSGWTAAVPMLPMKKFKIFIQDEQEPITVEIPKENWNQNLLHLFEQVSAKKKWGDAVSIYEGFGFQYLETSKLSPPMKFSTKISELNESPLRLIKKEKSSLGNSTSATGASTSPQTEPIGTPYNVYHVQHKSVEDLIKLMEKNLAKESALSEVPSSSLISTHKDFEIELGDPKGPRLEDSSNRRLIDSDKNTPYYKHYFWGKQHVSFWADCGPKMGPLIVSIEVMPKTQPSPDIPAATKLRALVRTKYDDEWIFLKAEPKIKKASLIKAIEQQCKNGSKMKDLKLHEISQEHGPKLLVEMEAKLLVKGYKFGILYCKPNQALEDDMFGNVETSKEFEEFLEWMGEKVVLKGWEKYRGGLDVKTDTTGTHSIYTTHLGYEIMFHVSTLLPYFAKDKQQLERKRHLGNDVVVLVFKDSDEPFAPNTVKSEFNHVFMVVTPDRTSEKTRYKVAFAYKGGVGMSTPLLPQPAVFEKSAIFRDYMMTKLINSERNSMYAPSFVTKLAKTKELQMLDLIESAKKLD